MDGDPACSATVSRKSLSKSAPSESSAGQAVGSSDSSSASSHLLASNGRRASVSNKRKAQGEPASTTGKNNKKRKGNRVSHPKQPEGKAPQGEQPSSHKRRKAAKSAGRQTSKETSSAAALTPSLGTRKTRAAAVTDPAHGTSLASLSSEPVESTTTRSKSKAVKRGGRRKRTSGRKTKSGSDKAASSASAAPSETDKGAPAEGSSRPSSKRNTRGKPLTAGSNSRTRSKTQRKTRSQHPEDATMADKEFEEEDDFTLFGGHPYEDDEEEEEEDDVDGMGLDQGRADLANLLERLAGNMGIARGFSSGNRFERLLQSLKSGDDSRILAALDELSQLLLMGTEDTLRGFRVSSFVEILGQLINVEFNPQIAILAARALTNMLEALPESANNIAPLAKPLCEKLLCIEYIDLAEQCLSCIYKLAKERGKSVLQSGGMTAVLTYLDFFPTSVQKTAVMTAADIAQHVTPQLFSMAKDVLPNLSQLLDPQRDVTVFEYACVTVSRLVEGIQSDASNLKEVADSGVLSKMLALLQQGRREVGEKPFGLVLKVLSVMARGSDAVAVQMFQGGVMTGLKTLLSAAARQKESTQPMHVNEGAPSADTQTEGSESATEAAGMGAQVANNIKIVTSPQQLVEILNLVSNLLPRLTATHPFVPHCTSCSASAITAEWKWRDDDGSWQDYSIRDMKQLEAAHQAGQNSVMLVLGGRRYKLDLQRQFQVNLSTGNPRRIMRVALPEDKVQEEKLKGEPTSDARNKFFRDHPDQLLEFGATLIPILARVYSDFSGVQVKLALLECLLRFVATADPQALVTLLENVRISSYLAEMLNATDSRIVIGAISVADALIKKLPEIFHLHFRRQGVVHRLWRLASEHEPEPTEDKSSSGTASSGPPSTSTPLKASASSAQAAASPAALSAPTSMDVGEDEGEGDQQEDADDGHGDSNDGFLQRAMARRRSQLAKRKRERLISRKRLLEEQRRRNKTEVETTKERAKKEAAKLAFDTASQHFDFKHGQGPQLSDISHEAFARLRAATELAKELGHSMQSKADTTAAHRQDVLGRILELFDESEPATSFEVVKSGLVDALNDFMTSPPTPTLVPIRSRLAEIYTVVLRPALQTGRTGVLPRLASMVSMLQNTLTFVERFSGGEDQGQPAVSLSQPIKLRLEKSADAGDSVQDFNAQMVLIEPLASIQAIEDFLWPRVRPPKRLERRRPGSRSASSRRRSARHAKSPLSRSGSGSLDASRNSDVSEREFEDNEEDYSDSDENEPGRSRDAFELKLTKATSAFFGDEQLPRSFAGAPSTGKRRLEILLNGHPLPPHITIFQAIQMYGGRTSGAAADGDEEDTEGDAGLDDSSYLPSRVSSLLSEVQTVHFRRHSRSKSANLSVLSMASESATDAADRSIYKPSPSDLEADIRLTNLDGIEDEDVKAVLSLLHALSVLNARWWELPVSEADQHVAGPQQGAMSFEHPEILSPVSFNNKRLSSKIVNHVRDFNAICRGKFPQWCLTLTSKCPFLMPLEDRHGVFFYTALGSARALQRYKAEFEGGEDGSDSQERFRLSKVKVRVDRKRILESVHYIMHCFANVRTLLEVEYFDEVGTGLGPTLEFYALASKEFQRASLGMWRGSSSTEPTLEQSAASSEKVDDVEASLYVSAPNGLFPLPCATGKRSRKVLDLFETLGRLVAKAIQDDRVLDFNFNPLFYYWLLGKPIVSLSGVQMLDEELWRSLKRLEAFVQEKRRVEDANRDADAAALKNMLEDIRIDDATVADLCLDFTFDGIELVDGGSSKEVTIHNIEEFVERAVNLVLRDGIVDAMDAFITGFNSIVSSESLGMFYAHEIPQVLCGNAYRPWTIEELARAVRTDHGYRHDSTAIEFLFDVLSSLDRSEQRGFVAFVTGAPNLPVGGLRALRPRLTVVRKDTEPGQVDLTLPSAMTCQNYLKLPEYSSKQVMRNKLMTAIQEGSGSFHLS